MFMENARLKIFSGSALKMIAVITMLIDHAAHIFKDDFAFMANVLFSLGGKEYTVYYLLRLVGRLAFPLFCFLIVEGYLHTKNVKKYLLRLFVFALVSEIPFNLLICGKIFGLSHQNVFFTLLLGVLLLYISDNVKSLPVKAVLMLALAVVAVVFRADYGLLGVLLILLIYHLRDHPAAQALLAYPMLSGGVAALAAFIPINMYSGQRGFIKSKVLKFAFYLFYPLHILVLVAIKHLI